MERYKNSLSSSAITAVITCRGDGCGLLGSRIIIERGPVSQECRIEYIGAFLNDAISEGTISKKLERDLVAEFADVLQKVGGDFEYTGIGVKSSYHEWYEVDGMCCTKPKPYNSALNAPGVSIRKQPERQVDVFAKELVTSKSYTLSEDSVGYGDTEIA